MNCGDLGHSSHAIEKQLDRVLALAARWGAVVLVDEADVFLAERQTENLEQSGLVSGKIGSGCTGMTPQLTGNSASSNA